MRTFVNRLFRDDQGQDLIEYAILIGLITVGVITILIFIGGWVQGQFQQLADELSAAS